jgi:hypothetical protein
VNFKQFPEVVVSTKARPGTFIITKIDFRDYRKCRGRLYSNFKKIINIMISFDDYKQRMKSCANNEKNGLLDGDQINAKYVITYDKIANKKIYEIIYIIETKRSDQPWQHCFDYSIVKCLE